MDYNLPEDIRSIRSIRDISIDDMATLLDVEKVTLYRNEAGTTKPSAELLEKVYDFAFRMNIKLNILKEMMWKETLEDGHVLLFHGAKDELKGELNIKAGRLNNDFGQGFYAGERYDQAVSFIAGFNRPSVYMLDFDAGNLKYTQYKVDQDWMMTIAYYRGDLKGYESHPLIKKLVRKSRNCDYIIAPIADNRMFQIIRSFIDGEITDEQCKHCLAATNLGMQYVFTSDRAIRQVKLLERCYICNKEKEQYMRMRSADARLGDDKVKLARIQYRGKGKYIDEILD